MVDIYGSGTPISGGSFVVQRDLDTWEAWIRAEFAPITLATPSDTVKQMIENAIRYWNTHSAHKTSAMYDTERSGRIQVGRDEG